MIVTSVTFRGTSSVNCCSTALSSRVQRSLWQLGWQLIIMPSSTSKIPLPKSQLAATSPNGSSPTTSKIPLKKDFSRASRCVGVGYRYLMNTPVYNDVEPEYFVRMNRHWYLVENDSFQIWISSLRMVRLWSYGCDTVTMLDCRIMPIRNFSFSETNNFLYSTIFL